MTPEQLAELERICDEQDTYSKKGEVWAPQLVLHTSQARELLAAYKERDALKAERDGTREAWRQDEERWRDICNGFEVERDELRRVVKILAFEVNTGKFGDERYRCAMCGQSFREGEQVCSNDECAVAKVLGR